MCSDMGSVPDQKIVNIVYALSLCLNVMWFIHCSSTSLFEWPTVAAAIEYMLNCPHEFKYVRMRPYRTTLQVYCLGILRRPPHYHPYQCAFGDLTTRQHHQCDVVSRQGYGTSCNDRMSPEDLTKLLTVIHPAFTYARAQNCVCTNLNFDNFQGLSPPHTNIRRLHTYSYSRSPPTFANRSPPRELADSQWCKPPKPFSYYIWQWYYQLYNIVTRVTVIVPMYNSCICSSTIPLTAAILAQWH